MPNPPVYDSLSRARERAGGEAGLSSRMRRAGAAVRACKPERALQVRVFAHRQGVASDEAQGPPSCAELRREISNDLLCEPLRPPRFGGA